MLNLPRLPPGFASMPNQPELLQRYWEELCRTIEANDKTQQELIVTLQQTVARIKRLNSHTLPTTIMIATDDGATASIELLDHTRVYADGTQLSVTGTLVSGLDSDTPYSAYYDDVTLESETPTFVFTKNIEEAQAVSAEGRHFLGVIGTPSAGSGTTREGGGVYAIGSSIGGEV